MNAGRQGGRSACRTARRAARREGLPLPAHSPAVCGVADDTQKDKNEIDRVKNMIDLYKITSEECRHTADIIWRFSIAILTLEGTAVGAVVAHPSYYTAAILGFGGLVGRNLSRMLLRQADIRSAYLKRLHATESQLHPAYPSCFAKIPEGSIHDYKSTDLAKFLLGTGHLMIFVSVAWLTCELVCRSTPHGLMIR